jgi:hypothetical protein
MIDAATQTRTSPSGSPEGESMTGMPITPAHAKPVSRRDHLWVLAIVAAFALYDVWGSWTEIGNKSGFAHGTGWTLTVIVEVYWGYALYAWLAAAPGPRSRRFAMWSAAAVFVLSLIGQGVSHLAAHRMPPSMVVVFVSVLPVIVLALLAILVHLRHLDRAEAAEVVEAAARIAGRAAMEAAEADERAALRAELESLREDVRAAETARNEAAQEAANATAKAETLARKLASIPGPGRTRSGRAKNPATGGRKSAGTQVPGDVDAQAEALAIIAREPEISGARLGARVGKSERWGQLLKSGLAAASGPEGGNP